MVAVLEEYFDNGGSDGSPTETKVDALGPPRLKMKTADDPTIDNVNPVPKPAAGINYSFWKQVYLMCATAPDTMCNNFRWYTDGSNTFGAGIALKLGTQHPVKTSVSNAGYEKATGVVGESGDVMTDHSGITASADAFGYTSGSPKTVSCGEAGNLINAIGECTNYIVLQAEVGTGASAGTPANETVTWKWDEI